MTVTEDAPAAAPASSEPTAPAPAATGLAAILGTGDHKVVGRIWLVASLLQLVLAGAAAIWVSVLRIDAEQLAQDAPDFFAQAFTFRGIAGTFLFLLPITIGLATVVVPLQVGAATIAFPRAAAAAAWTYLLGGALVVAAYAIDGGALGDDTDGVRLFTLAFLLVLVALVVAWICIATTVIALRPTGMSLRRVPLFAWSTLVAGTAWVVMLSVLAGVVVISLHRPALRRRLRLHHGRRRRHAVRPHRLGVRPAGGLRLRHPCPGLHRVGGPRLQLHPSPAPPPRDGAHRCLRGLGGRSVGTARVGTGSDPLAVRGAVGGGLLRDPGAPARPVRPLGADAPPGLAPVREPPPLRRRVGADAARRAPRRCPAGHRADQDVRRR